MSRHLQKERPYSDECVEKYEHLYTTDGNVIFTTILRTIQQYFSDTLIMLSSNSVIPILEI